MSNQVKPEFANEPCASCVHFMFMNEQWPKDDYPVYVGYCIMHDLEETNAANWDDCPDPGMQGGKYCPGFEPSLQCRQTRALEAIASCQAAREQRKA